MIEVIILERIKDSEGQVKSYVIQNVEGGRKLEISASTLEENAELGVYIITNATHLDGGGFRANAGAKIKTSVKMDVGVVNSPVVKFAPNPDKSFPNDYYGREFINFCKRVRQLAVQGRIEIAPVFRQHTSNSGNNLHLFKLIEACGVSVEDFLQGYLSVLQPYSLVRYKSEAFSSSDIVGVLDVGYRVALLIKLEKKSSQDFVLVSFHESNKIRGNKIAQTRGGCTFSDKLCAVFVTKFAPSGLYPGKVDCDFIMQRGFVRRSISVRIPECRVNKGVALVAYSTIDSDYKDVLNTIINDLQSAYLRTVENDIDSDDYKDIVPNPSGTSILSFGYTTISNISLLLDCFMTFTGKKERAIIAEVTSNLLAETPQEILTELKYGLMEKYSKIINYDNELYEQVLYLCGEEE